MSRSGPGTYSMLQQEEGDGGYSHDTTPLVYQPSSFPQPGLAPAAGPVMMGQTSNTNVVELQPMSGQQPVIQVVPRPQANDHLYLTVALMLLCLLLGCNTIGALSLIPGLICAAVGADYNKAGDTEKARSCGSIALIYDIVIVIINAVGFGVGILIAIIAVATSS